MTLDLIRQNANSIVEASYLYDQLLRDGKEAEEIRDYMLSLLSNIDELVETEESNLQND